VREAQGLLAAEEAWLVTLFAETVAIFAVRTRDVRSGDPATVVVQTDVHYQCAAAAPRPVRARLTLETAREVNPAAPEFAQAYFSARAGRTVVTWREEALTKSVASQAAAFRSHRLVSVPQTDGRVPGNFALARRFEPLGAGQGRVTLRVRPGEKSPLVVWVHESEALGLDLASFSPRPDRIEQYQYPRPLFYVRPVSPAEITFEVSLPDGAEVGYPQVTVEFGRQHRERPPTKEPALRQELALGDDRALLELDEPFLMEKAWTEQVARVVLQQMVG